MASFGDYDPLFREYLTRLREQDPGLFTQAVKIEDYSLRRSPRRGDGPTSLFAELKRWINELPPHLQQLLTTKSDRVELTSAASEAFISARTSRAETPEALAGVHSENVLLVLELGCGLCL